MAGRRNALSGAVLRSVLTRCRWRCSSFAVSSSSTRIRRRHLITRLRAKYRIQLLVMLLDHLAQSRDRSTRAGTAIALTGQDNEPFVVHVMQLRGRHDDVAISIREIGSDITAFKDLHHLSRREIQVAELGAAGTGTAKCRDPGDYAGNDQETLVSDLREGRGRFTCPAGQQAGLTAPRSQLPLYH